MTDWPMLETAKRVADLMLPASDQVIPQEILRLDAETSAIVSDVDGVDYIFTMSRVPLQRTRPTKN